VLLQGQDPLVCCLLFQSRVAGHRSRHQMIHATHSKTLCVSVCL
jgi:hypothetical protein